MARKSTRTVKRKTPARPGLHPVFGPVADPGPSGFGPVADPGPGLGHFGPVADPGPGFWHSAADRVERSKLAAEDRKALNDLRLRRVNAAIAALEAQAQVADQELELLSRKGVILSLPEQLHPRWPQGDPGPELAPIDRLRFVHDVRMSVLRRTVQYLKDTAKAIESMRDT